VLATLQGHTDCVTACAVTPDGRHVVSASNDQTLKVWELVTHTCRITHRGDAGYAAVAVGATTIIAGDAAGGVWFLEMPPSMTSPVPQTRQPSTSLKRWWRRLWSRRV
jgi:WD40 repeat protein